MPTDSAHPLVNRLKDAKSPYLLQHQHNPVDWFPWGDEAFEEARNRDVPVFLSIGYATCHWCHVMERESFEDADVAALMNQHFVSIKVDREERPDIDDVYMTVCHLMGRQGGWPLTVILTPERQPFYVATYLPKTARLGRLGMVELIPRVADLWKASRERVEESAREVVTLLERSAATDGDGGPGGTVESAWLENAYVSLRSRYDAAFGGFGAAPKFPSPHNLSFLFRYGARTGEDLAGAMARDTVHAMWRGGVFDQIGFGFHRYSTDVEWRLPHFEKMLHDQATMLEACVDGWLGSEGEELQEVGLQIAEYVLRDLTHPEGGFYSAEDADSEGEEGRFYVWTHQEAGEVLGADDLRVAVEWFGLTKQGNYLDESTRQPTGANVLHPSWSGAPPAEDRLAAIRARLMERRVTRERPLRDEKVLTDWNGLMIGSLARAGRAFSAPRLVEAAQRAYRFLRTELKGDSGWLHRWFEDDAAVPAMLDDYAFLGAGLFELFQATSDPDALEDAINLADSMIDFCSAPDGGFYRSSTAGENLLVRKQDWYDGAMPAGVSHAVGLLLNLGTMVNRPDFIHRAELLISAARRVLETSPAALTAFLAYSVRAWSPGPEVVVVAPRPDDPLVEVARRLSRPGGVVFWLPADGPARDRIQGLIPWVRGMGLVDGKAGAYVCRDYTCDLPVMNEESLRAALGDTEASRE